MFLFALGLTGAARTTGSGAICKRLPSLFSPLSSYTVRLLSHSGGKSSHVNPIALQMIDYALSLARSQKSDESYEQGQLVLEQCLSSEYTEAQDAAASENVRGMTQLAMSTLLSERGNLDEAIEHLQSVRNLTKSSLGVRVAAMEALIGLHLELGQDDASSVLTDKCSQMLETYGSCDASDVLRARLKAIKGLVELVQGNGDSAKSFFHGEEAKDCNGNVALSYGELLHATRRFELAKKFYQNVIEVVSEGTDFRHPTALAACNMSSGEVLSAAACALGQLQAHMSNFGDAEEILTRALTKTEDCFGQHHPKVGVVLTCIALMFRQKAVLERSSALLIQEGLYRKALDLLKAPTLESQGAEETLKRRDIMALARGGYGDVLSVQQNRKDEGEKMKGWARSVWRNRRLSLAEALDIPDASTKVPVLDVRIGRVL